MRVKFDRREFLVVAGGSVTATALSKLPAVLAQQATGGAQRMKPELANVKACVFDTFGTVVDCAVP